MKPAAPRVKVAPPGAADPGADERALGELTTLDAGSRTHGGASAATATLPRGTVLGRHVLLGCLGHGGMGVVYAAYDPDLDRKIALKLLLDESKADLSTEARARLLREAQAMARLSHPNVIAVHDVGAFDGQIFIAMEFVEGRTLRAWLGEKERAVPEILAMFTQAGRGLAAAHAQGIVHRDFKPDNVLVGADGRARVLDFGLAHAEGDGGSVDRPDVASPSSRVLDAALTRTGSLMGTPLYMAPEQFRGEPTSARTDQFSFCVALYEALYGETPFGGDTLEARGRQVLEGKVRAEPRGRRLPAQLRRALLRGLSVASEDRFPSMEALLAAIAPAPARSPWRWAAVASAVLVPAAVVGVLAASREGPGARCEGAEAKLAGVWDGEQKRAIESTFIASGKPYARDAFRSTERVLNSYTSDWVAMHTDACLATHVRGEQSEELLDLRMDCLSQRLEEARALTGLLATADAELVERSVEAARSLTRLDGCADAAALKAPVRPPSDAGTRAKVEELRAQIARIHALNAAGRYAEARSAAEAAAAEAARLSYRPIEAEALHVLGAALRAGGELARTEETLMRAVVAAEAGRNDALAARAWIDLLSTRVARGALDRARESGLHASAMLERVGDAGTGASDLENALGGLARSEGRYDDANAHYQRALEGYEKLHGSEHPGTAAVLHNLAMVADERGRFAEAAVHYQRSLAIREKVHGPEHPSVAVSLCNLGGVLVRQGKHDEARALELRALAIDERALGPDHIGTAAVLLNLADLEGAEGKYEEALARYERALAIRERVFGADHVNVAMTLNDVGATLVLAEKPEKALSYLERSIAIQEKAHGPEHPQLAMTLTNLGDALRKLGREQDAMERYERALRLAEKGLGAEHPYVADALVGMGKALLAMRAPKKAVPLLERALAVREELDEDPALVAEARFVLARALVGDREGRARALALAESAREAFAKAGKRSEGDLAEVAAWLRARQ